MCIFGSSKAPPQRVTPQGTKDWTLTHYNGNIYDPKPDDEVAEAMLDVVTNKPKPTQTSDPVDMGLNSGLNTSNTSSQQTQSGLTIY